MSGCSSDQVNHVETNEENELLTEKEEIVEIPEVSEEDKRLTRDFDEIKEEKDVVQTKADL